MTGQGWLFEEIRMRHDETETVRYEPARAVRPPAPYQRGSAGSMDGAVAIEGDLARLEAKALRAYRRAGERGLTDQELSDAIGVKVTTCIPRRHSLIERGLVTPKPVGRRPGGSGVRIGYWCVTAEGAKA